MNAKQHLEQARRDQVAREDLVMFVNACFACSGQREFYSDGQDQRVSIDFLHRYILGNYRLSAAQTRRAYLLQLLSQAEWHLDTAAAGLRVTRDDFVLRLEKAGFGYLLAGEVRDAARKSRPTPARPLI